MWFRAVTKGWLTRRPYGAQRQDASQLEVYTSHVGSVSVFNRSFPPWPSEFKETHTRTNVVGPNMRPEAVTDNGCVRLIFASG